MGRLPVSAGGRAPRRRRGPLPRRSGGGPRRPCGGARAGRPRAPGRGAGRHREVAAQRGGGAGRTRRRGRERRRRRAAAALPLRRRRVGAPDLGRAAAAEARAGIRGVADSPRDQPAPQRHRTQGQGAQGAQRDRHPALRPARHQEAARPDPAEEPRDHRRRRRQPVPGRARPAPLQAGAERHHGTFVRGAADAARRELDRGLRGRHRPPAERPRRLPAVAGLALPHQPLVRRDVGLPHEVDAGGADARPRERRDRRRPADQQEAGPLGGATAGGARRGGGDPVHLDRREAGRARLPARPRSPSRTPT